jgi:hypothetical protein
LRPGIALFAALSLLAFLGLLLGAAVASMTIAGRSSRLAELDAQLDAAADFALNTVFSDPDQFDLATAPFGRPQSLVVTIPTSNASESTGPAAIHGSVTTTRLRSGLLWIVAQSRSGSGGGVRHVSGIARFLGPTQLPRAPLIARGSILTDSSVVFESDTASDRDCAAGVSVAPHTLQASDSSLFYLSAAQRALFDSAPNVVRFPRDTTLGPGAISGILIADGALHLVGPLSVEGLVIARGPISANRGVNIIGAIMSFDTTSKNSITLNDDIVRYSPCAVARAFRRLSPPQRLRARTWLEVF